MRYLKRSGCWRPAVLLALCLGATACASNPPTGGVPPGGYPWCPPPCYYPRGALGDRDFSDLQFFYPATPYLYDPFDPFWGSYWGDYFWGEPWFVYRRPLPPPRKPPAPNRQPVPPRMDRR